MDISNIDSAATAPIQTDPVAPVSTTATAAATEANANAAAAASSIVEFSPLAQLLAVTVLFQTKQGQALAPGTTGNPGTTSFQQLVDAANAFVNAFNAFQDSINGSYASSYEVTFDNAFLLALQDENTQSGANSIQSFINNLAQLGIDFQGDNNLGNPNYFQFNLTALEQAYANSPGQTAALLNTAFQGLGTLEDQLLTALAANQNLTVAQTATYTIPTTANTANTGVPAGSAAQSVATAEMAAAAEVAATGATVAPVAAAPVNTASTPAANPVPPAATTMPLAFDPVTIGPLIAQAVAAYRVVENIAPPPINLLDPTPAIDTVPDVIETTRVEPIGPDTPRGPASRQTTEP
jgi:hypothetical protein